MQFACEQKGGLVMMFGRGYRQGWWNREAGDRLVKRMGDTVKQEFVQNADRQDEGKNLEATC